MAENDSTLDSPRRGSPRKVPEDHIQCIDNAMIDNAKVTAADLKDILTKKFEPDHVHYGVRTIARMHSELGWMDTTARYSQAILSADKEKWLDSCTECIDEKETFDDVL